MSYGDRNHEQSARDIMPTLTREEMREVTKLAIKELVREQVTEFGWWSLKTFGVAVLGAVVLFVLYANGYGKA